MERHVVEILKSGGVGVMPTDTIYGIVGSALRPKTVTRIYRARRRSVKKPMIILISATSDLKKFGIALHPKILRKLRALWPGRVSIIFPCRRGKFAYLHRGTKTLAFRIPKPAALRRLLRETGPLVAPSANPEGKHPARNIAEAKKYFGDRIDFYADGGRRDSRPSKLVTFQERNIVVIRP